MRVNAKSKDPWHREREPRVKYQKVVRGLEVTFDECLQFGRGTHFDNAIDLFTFFDDDHGRDKTLLKPFPAGPR